MFQFLFCYKKHLPMVIFFTFQVVIEIVSTKIILHLNFILFYFYRQQEHALKSAKKEGGRSTYVGYIHRKKPNHTLYKDGLH